MKDSSDNNQPNQSWVPPEGYANYYLKLYDMTHRKLSESAVSYRNLKNKMIFDLDYSKFISSKDSSTGIITFNVKAISDEVFKRLAKRHRAYGDISFEYAEFLKSVVAKLFHKVNEDKKSFTVPTYAEFTEFFFKEDVQYADKKSKEFPFSKYFGQTEKEATAEWYFRIMHYTAYDILYGGEVFHRTNKECLKQGNL